jgi:hypothetical protein
VSQRIATSDRPLGWLAAAIGGALALALQVASPVGVPLYDGASVVEPYRFLHPTGNQVGDPTSFTSMPTLKGNQSPVFAAATLESPPQAQLVAMEDAFSLPQGITKLMVSITPIDPPAAPVEGSIAGNVYRISVTDQAGTPLASKPCDDCRSLVLRAPETMTEEGTIRRFANGEWTEVATLHAGMISMYQANVDELGDYAVFGTATGGPGGLDPLVFGGIALAGFLAVVAGLFWYRRRPPPIPVARLGAGRGRVPSKRRGPRRPPSGRS